MTNFLFATTLDIDCYDYEEGRIAIVVDSKSARNTGSDMVSDDIIYALIPRYVRKVGSNEIKYLYVISNYIISFNYT